jgi:hypothetical protein
MTYFIFSTFVRIIQVQRLKKLLPACRWRVAEFRFEQSECARWTGGKFFYAPMKLHLETGGKNVNPANDHFGSVVGLRRSRDLFRGESPGDQ